MFSFEEIKGRSVVRDELVVSYTDAMELLHIYEQNSTQVAGWEGWIKYSDGSLGHSQQHQGTVDISEMPIESAISLVKSTIMQAHTEWVEKPEVNGAHLYFCITTET